MHIAIAGNIGSGKTTLTKILTNYFEKAIPFYEDLTNNPYIDDFYQDMKRWGFNLQVLFLSNRLHQVNKIHRVLRHSDNICIQDRSIYEDYYVFAKNLWDMNILSSRDYEAYQQLFSNMLVSLPEPDLIVYLKSDTDTLLKQIAKRGREYEKGIDKNYLENLNHKYEDWISNFDKVKTLTVEVKDWNLDKPEDTNKIISMLDSHIRYKS